MAEQGSNGPVEQAKKRRITSLLRPRKLKVVSVVILVVIVLVAAGLYWRAQNKVDCQKLTNEATQLIKSNKYKEAYSKLSPHAKACTGNKAKQTNNARLEYNFRLAVSAFQSGKTDQAKVYAKNTQGILKAMSQPELNKIPEQGNLLVDMYGIATYGIYPRARSL